MLKSTGMLRNTCTGQEYRVSTLQNNKGYTKFFL